MQDSILQEGIDLMLFGMGTVFLFLTLLVIATAIMSAIIRRYFPDAVLLQKMVPSAPESSTTPANDPKLIAIIQAAIDQHRGKK